MSGTEDGLTFAIKILECFPEIRVNSEQFMNLIDAKFLSNLTSKGKKLDTHVELCATLLAKENPSEQKKFYDTILQFDNQDWVFTFVSGLLKKPLQGDQESIKTLICGESFMPKLLEAVKNSDKGLTEEGITLLLASMKYGKFNSKISYPSFKG